MRFKNMKPNAPGIFGNPEAYDPYFPTFGAYSAGKRQEEDEEIGRMPLLGMMPPTGPANLQDFSKMAMAGAISPEQYNDPTLFQNMEQAPAPKEKGKFFGEGGIGRLIAGSIGDALLTQAKMEPIYAPEMARRAAAERDLEKEEKQMQSLLKVWAAKNAAPEVVKTRNGGIGIYTPGVGYEQVQQDTPESTPFVENTLFMEHIRRQNKELYKRLIKGEFNNLPGFGAERRGRNDDYGFRQGTDDLGY